MLFAVDIMQQSVRARTSRSLRSLMMLLERTVFCLTPLPPLLPMPHEHFRVQAGAPVGNRRRWS